MTIRAALRDGIHRVNSAPMVLAGLLLVTLLLALPLGLALRDMLRTHLGDSLAADTLASGVNYDWWQEFSAQASGIGTTFTPTIIGFGAVLDNLSGLLDNDRQSTVIVGAATAYLVVWAFLIGGILDRFARSRPTRSHGFFAASGVFFFRFLRLAIVMGLAYYILFGVVHGWLFGGLFKRLTRDLTVERTAFLWRAALYTVFGGLMAVCNMVFDYAKIRAVVEDRHSMIGALAAAVRFVRRHPRSTFGLYLFDGVLFVMVIALYALVAPGAGTTGAAMWTGFLIGQLYLAARLWVKLVFYASQTALFQGELAHVGYTAGPQPVWPESPAAEAIVNAARR